MQTVNGFVQPRRTTADKRKPAASTARSRHIEFTPTSALDQLGLLVQSRLPSGDETLARFKQNIVPQLEAAYNFARFLSRDADAAQDIVQEAFLRAYRSFAGYRGGDARAWIFTIVRNCYRSWLMDRRKSRLEVEPRGKGDSEEVILNISSDEDTPEAMLVRKAESQTVRFIRNMMPRALREILVLRELEELSYRQMSDITALPIGTVMSRLARARKAFGDAWGRETKILAEPTAQSLRGAEPGALHFAFSSLLRLMRVLGLAILAMTLSCRAETPSSRMAGAIGAELV